MLRDCLVLNVVTSAIALSAFEVPLAAEAKVLEANGGTSKKPVCILSKTSTKTGAKKKHKGKPLELLSGIASWYGHPFHGRRTASGQIFDMNKLTAAHLTIPLSSKVLVVLRVKV